MDTNIYTNTRKWNSHRAVGKRFAEKLNPSSCKTERKTSTLKNKIELQQKKPVKPTDTVHKEREETINILFWTNNKIKRACCVFYCSGLFCAIISTNLVRKGLNCPVPRGRCTGWIRIQTAGNSFLAIIVSLCGCGEIKSFSAYSSGLLLCKNIHFVPWIA